MRSCHAVVDSMLATLVSSNQDPSVRAKLVDGLIKVCCHALIVVFGTAELTNDVLTQLTFNPAKLQRLCEKVSEQCYEQLPENESEGLARFAHAALLQCTYIKSKGLPMPKWLLGLEWFSDETGKQFLGEAIARANTSEELEADIAALLGWVTSIANNPQPGNKHHANIAQVVKSGEFWLHLIDRSDLASKPKTMLGEPTLEANLGQGDEDLCSQYTSTEKFFNAQGEERQSQPEVWMLQAGCF